MHQKDILVWGAFLSIGPVVAIAVLAARYKKDPNTPNGARNISIAVSSLVGLWLLMYLAYRSASGHRDAVIARRNFARTPMNNPDISMR